MKKYVLEFVHRGLAACGLGPLVLAVIYFILQQKGVAETLPVREVCLGIVSLSVLAFLAGGMNVLYQVERLPLMVAILIHGGVLYIGYLVTYLVNDWLEWGPAPVLVFSGIFVLGFCLIWAIIYAIIKKNTSRINESLKKKREISEEA